MDGVAEGWITLGNTGAATATINTYTVTLLKTDNVPDNETTLGVFANTISTGNTIVQNNSIKFPVYIPIAKQKIDYNERIILKIEYTSTDGTVNILHDNDSTYEDIKIKLPYSTG